LIYLTVEIFHIKYKNINLISRNKRNEVAVNGENMDLEQQCSYFYPESHHIDFRIGSLILKGIANVDGSYTDEKGHLSE